MTYSPDQCDVSVVLPVYNEKGHLRAEIDRVRAALTASRFSFEIIVVDDGSSDNTFAVVSGFMANIRYHKQDNGQYNDKPKPY